MLLTPKAQGELMKLFYTHRRELFDRRFEEFVSEEFFASNFWVYWLSMFAIGPWHSALEMKLYMNRFVQHFGGMADLSTIKFTRLNQFDSLILPLVKWLEQQGVTIVYDTKVTNVVFDIIPERKVARRIEWIQGGKRGGRDVTKNDIVLITNSSAVENGGTTTPQPSGLGTSRRAASGRCGATSPPRTPPSAAPTSSVPTPTRAAMSRHASSPSTTRFRSTTSGSASATRTVSTGVPSPAA